MTAVSSFYATPPANLVNYETQSLRSVIELDEETAGSALNEIKCFLNAQDSLLFQRLTGGDCNAPILVLRQDGSPLAVLKPEENTPETRRRLQALDEIRQSGFDKLPLIFHYNDYLICFGERAFSCIEYLKPDDNLVPSLEAMLQLASQFHAHTKNSRWTQELLGKTLYLYIDYPLEPPPENWETELFASEEWKICVDFVNYYASSEFVEIYEKLPMQIIHGDLTPNNTVTCKGKTYLVDLDKVRTDVRIIDFAALCGWSYLERYLELAKSGELHDFIQRHYGPLEEIEYQHFHQIVMLFRCGVLKWSLKELSTALSKGDQEKVQQFERIFKGTIREIHQIHSSEV